MSGLTYQIHILKKNGKINTFNFQARDHVYYCVEMDQFWISPFDVGDFKRKDHTGRWTYKYLGEL